MEGVGAHARFRYTGARPVAHTVHAQLGLPAGVVAALRVAMSAAEMFHEKTSMSSARYSAESALVETAHPFFPREMGRSRDEKGRAKEGGSGVID